jgi:hypothetical protein
MRNELYHQQLSGLILSAQQEPIPTPPSFQLLHQLAVHDRLLVLGLILVKRDRALKVLGGTLDI